MSMLVQNDCDVLVVGDYCLDLIFTGLPSQPILGQEIISSGFEMIPGGACNSVVALHRMGVRVAWATDFGNDSFSRLVLDFLEKEGISSSHIIKHSRPMRKITISLSFPEDRAFIAYYDADPILPMGFNSITRTHSKLVLIPGLFYGLGMDIGVFTARRKGMKVFMDSNHSNPVSLKSRKVRKAIQSVDVFLPNASEVCRLTGSSDLFLGMKILGELVDLLIVKDGQNGSYAYSNDNLIHIPAIPIRPIDTTGAGDCFNAGFICAWLAGKDLSNCLKWGNIAGGLSTLKLGGTGRKVSREDLITNTKRYYI